MYADHVDFATPLFLEVPALFSPDECRALLGRFAALDWLPATINRSTGRAVDVRVRDNLTVLVRDPAIAADLFARIAPHVPATMTSAWDGPRRRVELAGLFEPLRVYRYEVGHHFGAHTDQSYVQAGARSLLTLLVYLDDDFAGGETELLEVGRTIVPRTGSVLWFQHALLHSGNRVLRGTKHVLRTDVLYR